MCSISVEPRPSTMSRPARFFQPVATSLDKISAAEIHSRNEERSALAASEAFTRAVYSVGSANNTVGRYSAIAWNTAAGSGRPGNITLDAPTANGKVTEFPSPYAKKTFGMEKQISS